MGAWGHRAFENDAAMDWLGDLRQGGPSLVEDALELVAGANEEEYVDVDDSSAALAAAELVAAAAGKGKERVHAAALAWLAQHGDALAFSDVDLARRAVERVLRRSELQDLWEEGGPDSEWHADVRELLRRLNRRAAS